MLHKCDFDQERCPLVLQQVNNATLRLGSCSYHDTSYCKHYIPLALAEHITTYYNMLRHVEIMSKSKGGIPEVAEDSSCNKLASSASFADDSLVCVLRLSIRCTRFDRMTPSQNLARICCSCDCHSEPIWHRKVSICMAAFWALLSCAVSSL